MNRLHEGDFGINDAARLEHAINLSDDATRLNHMLQHGLDPNAVDRGVGQRNVVGVGDEVGIGRCIDVETKRADHAGIFAQGKRPLSDVSAADVQDHGLGGDFENFAQEFFRNSVRRPD